MRLFFNRYVFQMLLVAFSLVMSLSGRAQIFKTVINDSAAKLMGDLRFYEIMCSRSGNTFISSSFGIWSLRGHQIQLSYGDDGTTSGVKNYRNFRSEDSILNMAEGRGGVQYFASHDNVLFYSFSSDNGGFVWPPFDFPPKGILIGKVSALFIDTDGDLFIGTTLNNFYRVNGAANKQLVQSVKYKIIDSIVMVEKGELPVKKAVIEPGYGVFSFAQDSADKRIIWVGTNHGLYRYNKITTKTELIWVGPGNTSTITHIEVTRLGDIWFSSLEQGMGFHTNNPANGPTTVYSVPQKKFGRAISMRIKTFCLKSDQEILVADMDSLPAIFNTVSKQYVFINDSSFSVTANRTTSVKADELGNLFIIKGGLLFYGNGAAGKVIDSNRLAPFIFSVSDWEGEEIASVYNEPELLKKVTLNYNRNSLIIFFDLNDLSDKTKVQFAWKIDKVTNGWMIMPSFNVDSGHFALIRDLKPGRYVFELKVRVGDGDWRSQQAKMIIIITPPFWKTWWFWSLIALGLALIIGSILWWRIKVVKKRERERFEHEKQILELEAKALRAQMNPHFIFNCMNSIKSLIQQDEKEKSITYLTTFSKLIRTLFNNADKKDISLYDEIETCKYYLQLEAMRFDAKFSYSVNVDENIDLKSIQVPALIIQPFIENAIWHGIVPRNSEGNVSLNVIRKDGAIEISIDDDGIGREASAKSRSATNLTHQSKGVNLTQTRLELNNLLQQRQAILETIDKKDEQGNSKGTTVIIKLKEELS